MSCWIKFIILFIYVGIIQSQMCPFNDQCYCHLQSDGTYSFDCSVDTTFPVFSASNLPITNIEIAGDFSVIYDNVFYLLSNITNASVLIIKNDFNNPSALQTFDNSFLTQKPDGITNIDFSFFNPVNFGDSSNAKYISTYAIQSANITKVPDLTNFSGLKNINLIDNVITSIQPSDFNLPSTPLQAISVIYNKITTVDSGFANWLKMSKQNVLYLASNPMNTCDTSIQWMANFAVCNPVQINLHGVNCQSGGSMSEYLSQFAKC